MHIYLMVFIFSVCCCCCCSAVKRKGSKTGACAMQSTHKRLIHSFYFHVGRLYRARDIHTRFLPFKSHCKGYFNSSAGEKWIKLIHWGIKSDFCMHWKWKKKKIYSTSKGVRFLVVETAKRTNNTQCKMTRTSPTMLMMMLLMMTTTRAPISK